MPGRKYEAQSGYRYGFNGKDKDKDMNSLTAYDYGFRIYNPGIGKFLSVDPISSNFPYYSPYQFAGNIAIAAIDLDGLEQYVVIYYKSTSNTITKIQVRAIFNNEDLVNALDQHIHKMDETEDIAKGNVLVFEAIKAKNGRYQLKIVEKRNVPGSDLTTQERKIFNSKHRIIEKESKTSIVDALAYPYEEPYAQFESQPFTNSRTITFKAVKVLDVKVSTSAVYLYTNPGPGVKNGDLVLGSIEPELKELPQNLKDDGTVKSLTITLTYYMYDHLSKDELNNFKQGVKNAGDNLKEYLKSNGVKKDINVVINTPTYHDDPTKPNSGRPANNSIDVTINR